MLEIGFFVQFVNTLLHLELSPCKIRAEPNDTNQ